MERRTPTALCIATASYRRAALLVRPRGRVQRVPRRETARPAAPAWLGVCVKGRRANRLVCISAATRLSPNGVGMRAATIGVDTQPGGCLYRGVATSTARRAREERRADEVFKALSDRSRRGLLDALRDHNGQSLTELCRGLQMTRQSVSKHLSVLETAALVTTVRRGREKLHYLNPTPINDIAERWISQYDQERVRALADLKRALENKP